MKKENCETFGKAVRVARTGKDMTQKELGLILGGWQDRAPYTPKHISDIERGRFVPSADGLIESLAGILDVPEDVLFYHAGLIPPDLRGVLHSDVSVITAMRALRKAVESWHVATEAYSRKSQSY